MNSLAGGAGQRILYDRNGLGEGDLTSKGNSRGEVYDQWTCILIKSTQLLSAANAANIAASAATTRQRRPEWCKRRPSPAFSFCAHATNHQVPQQPSMRDDWCRVQAAIMAALIILLPVAAGSILGIDTASLYVQRSNRATLGIWMGTCQSIDCPTDKIGSGFQYKNVRSQNPTLTAPLSDSGRESVSGVCPWGYIVTKITEASLY